MSDGLRLPEGSKFRDLHINEHPKGVFQTTIWATIPNETREYRLNIVSGTLKGALLEAGKFLDQGLGLDIGLSVKEPI